MSDDVLPWREAAVLAACVVLYNRHGRVSVRAIADEIDGGWSLSTIHAVLLRLLGRGLIQWEPMTHATLIPRLWPTRSSPSTLT